MQTVEVLRKPLVSYENAKNQTKLNKQYETSMNAIVGGKLVGFPVWNAQTGGRIEINMIEDIKYGQRLMEITRC